MTPDIIKAIADVLDAIEGVRAAETGEDEDGAWEILCDEGDSLGMALGIDSDATWLEVATALRALARPSTVDRLSDAVDEIERDTNAALLATITAAHDNDLPAASESATLAFALLGLDSAFRVRVERPDVGLPEGWAMEECGAGPPDRVRYEAVGPGIASAMVHRYTDGRIVVSGTAAPPAVYLHLLRAAGVAT